MGSVPLFSLFSLFSSLFSFLFSFVLLCSFRFVGLSHTRNVLVEKDVEILPIVIKGLKGVPSVPGFGNIDLLQLAFIGVPLLLVIWTARGFIFKKKRK